MQEQLETEKQALALLISSKQVIAGLADSIGGEEKLRQIAKETSPLAKGKVSDNKNYPNETSKLEYTSPTIEHLINM